MRRKTASKRGRVLALLLAGSVGYTLGAWRAAGFPKSDVSAAQAVSLRFPLDWQDTSAAAEPDPTATVTASTTDGSRFALLSPVPMVPLPAAPQQPVETAPAPQAATKAPEPKAAAAATSVPARRRTERPGFILNDAQIASIKQRLHLTADQEQMWPAVEAALRNIAYARAHDPHRRGAATTKLAAAEADSTEVQGLKSAAIPLLMSFSDTQKDEVRNLAHVMGLDQLASQF